MPYLKIICTAIAGLVLAGCMTTTSEAPDPRYAGVEPVIVEVEANRFLVYDKPSSNNALVTFLGSDSANFNPWLFGGSERPLMKAAVVKRKQQNGQSCDVSDGTLIAENVFEFRYRCKASAKSVRYCVTDAECKAFAAQGFAVDRSFLGATPTAIV